MISFLIDPIHVFWIFVVGYFIAKRAGKASAQKWLYIALIWLLITGSRWVPDLLVFGLERQYEVYIPSDSLDGKDVFIHVLGGGGINAPDLPDQEKLWSSSSSRMLEGIQLYRKILGSKLVFSGYSSTNNVTQAAITRDAAISLGIPEDDIFILEKPSTTEEEAKACKKFIDSSGGHLILVTSDIHMPRAMYLFNQAGLKPIAAPSDHILKNRCSGSGYPFCKKELWWDSEKGNFQKFSAAMHEYIGLLWARFRF